MSGPSPQPSRRELLHGLRSAAMLGAIPLLPSLSPGSTRTGSSPRNRLLVCVFLRGGIDGLNLIVPHADKEYYRLRPGIAIPRPSRKGGASLDLDGFFGLHPRAKPLHAHFKAGTAVAIEGVGHGKNTRSHFKEQDLWETAIPDNDSTSDGWLNRHLAAVDGAGPLRAVALSNSMPRLLRGTVPALAIRGLGDVGGRGRDTNEAMRLALEAGGKQTNELWAANARETLELLDELRAVEAHKIPTRVDYPDSYLATRLKEVGRLYRAGVGLEVAVVDYGGWDTHQNQGGSEGAYATRVGELCSGIDAFLRDFDDQLDEICVLTLSEFGRTAKENGTGGTDHGWGNVGLAFGGMLAASRPVIGEWPGLDPEELNKRRDLRITTDFRDVIGEVLAKHLANPDPARLLGRAELRPVGLV